MLTKDELVVKCSVQSSFLDSITREARPNQMLLLGDLLFGIKEKIRVASETMLEILHLIFIVFHYMKEDHYLQGSLTHNHDREGDRVMR